MAPLPPASEPDNSFSSDTPHVVVEATQQLLADLIQEAGDQVDLDRWQVTAAELDVDTPSTVQAAWMILVLDDSSGQVLGSTVVFEPRQVEVAAA